MLYWLGNKELEVRFSTAPIEHAFVRYGRPSQRCTVLSNVYHINNKKDLHRAFADCMDRMLASDPEAEFMFYASTYALGVLAIRPDLRSHIACLNSETLLSWLTNKSMTRFWASNYMSIPPSTMVSGGEVGMGFAESAFPGCECFVVQKNVSSAGRGTYLLNAENEHDVASALPKDDVYLLSPYVLHGRSGSSHMLIDPEKVTVLPTARQNIALVNERLRFCGSDYPLNPPQPLRNEVVLFSKQMGNALRLGGYRGYLGIDFLEMNGTCMFLEVNPRFQGSSFLIDRVLREQGLPALAALQLQCFSSGIPEDVACELEELNVGVGYTSTELANEGRMFSNKGEVLFRTSEPGQRFIFYRC